MVLYIEWLVLLVTVGTVNAAAEDGRWIENEWMKFSMCCFIFFCFIARMWAMHQEDFAVEKKLQLIAFSFFFLFTFLWNSNPSNPPNMIINITIKIIIVFL